MDARLLDEFLKSVVELLPVQAAPGPRGGRRPIAHAVVLQVIWFVLTVGCRWKDIPPELGCSGETARMRLKHWQETGVWQRVHHGLLRELKRCGVLKLETAIIDSNQVRAFGGGDRSGFSPVDLHLALRRVRRYLLRNTTIFQTIHTLILTVVCQQF